MHMILRIIYALNNLVLNFYVALTTVFTFGGESIERVQSVDSELFNCYEHARRHALSMIRKHGSFENTAFRGSN